MPEDRLGTGRKEMPVGFGLDSRALFPRGLPRFVTCRSGGGGLLMSPAADLPAPYERTRMVTSRRDLRDSSPHVHIARESRASRHRRWDSLP